MSLHKVNHHHPESVHETKYPGIKISRYASWKSHMTSTVAKGKNTLGFPKRNLRLNNENTRLKVLTPIPDGVHIQSLEPYYK